LEADLPIVEVAGNDPAFLRWLQALAQAHLFTPRLARLSALPHHFAEAGTVSPWPC